MVTYLVTRRTSQRYFRFPPGDDDVEQIFLFCLGYAAKKTGVLVHAWKLMSNHYHIVITDVHGVGPLFWTLLNRNMANLFKRHFGLPEELWNKSETSAVDLNNNDEPELQGVIEGITYTIGNAQKSGLVRDWREWDGACSMPEDMGGRTVRVKRPSCASPRTILPDEVSFDVVPPPVQDDLSPTDIAKLVNEGLDGMQVPEHPVGMAAVRAQGIWDRPNTPIQRQRKRAFKGSETRCEVLMVFLAQFHEDHRGAMKKFREGNRDVVFPRGTWKMVQLFGVKTAADPPQLAA